MQIKILKGTNEIGGSCVELTSKNTRILIDYGTPLKDNSIVVAPKEKVDAILISHPHQDHYGQIVDVDKSIPVYCGKLSLELMNATRIFTGYETLTNNFHYFKAWEKFTIGDFTITPYLVDHSATDAYAFLIEADGEKVLYSGDFRANGRKAKLFDSMINTKELKGVDVLLMEGTMIQRVNGDFPIEQSVEDKILETVKGSSEISFMIGSSQNIDSLVSTFRACVKSNKIFVVDIYTAWILENMKKVSDRMMNLNFSNVKVYKPTVKTGGGQFGKVKDNEEYFKNFRFKIFHKNNIITFDEIKQNPANYFIKCSPWYIENILEEINQDKANVIYSQWLGYLKEEFSDERTATLLNRLKSSYNWVYAHTSGHADLDTLKTFTNELKPKTLIPMHTEHKEEFEEHFKNVLVVNDDDVYDITNKTVHKTVIFEYVVDECYSEQKIVDLVDFKADSVDIHMDVLNDNDSIFTLKNNALTLNYNDHENTIYDNTLAGMSIESIKPILLEDMEYGEFKNTDITSELIGETDLGNPNMDEVNRLEECIDSGYDCSYIAKYSFIINLEVKLKMEIQNEKNR